MTLGRGQGSLLAGSQIKILVVGGILSSNKLNLKKPMGRKFGGAHVFITGSHDTDNVSKFSYSFFSVFGTYKTIDLNNRF